jgi:putative DNA primase/helicase
MNTTSFPPPCPFVTPADQLARAKEIAGAVSFSDLTSENIRWLWPDRIPLGRITLLVSDPGLGKSLLALDIAARVSTGAPWPDEELGAGSKEQGAQPSTSGSKLPAPSSVLLLTAEDDFADTVRPRLEALGADLDRILGIASVPGDKLQDVPRSFALQRDLARLCTLLEAMPDCRLVVIDPISAYLGSSNADVQSLLHSLTMIARERGVAVLIVSQLRKKEAAAIYRTMGNVAFVAASRASWAICNDALQENKRLLLPIKNNLAPHAAGLSYTIETGLDPRAPTIRWSPEPVTDSFDYAIAAARAAGRPDVERQHAMTWLKQRLAKSPIRASDAREEGEVQGITYATLRRAYREIGGVTVRKGRQPLTYWYWTLPGAAAQNPGGEFCAAGEDDDYDDLADFFEPWIRRASNSSPPTSPASSPQPPAPAPPPTPDA